MTLFLTLLPLYLIGNLHCFGMCGPLVMMIGQHRYRYFYFLGRLISFALAGGIAGEAGAVLHSYLKYYHLNELISLSLGGMICLIGLKTLMGWHGPQIAFLSRILRYIQQKISLLMLKDQQWTTFLFGLATVTLPCGQSLIVFSACALTGSFYVGLFNGFALALLTTPALFLAMQAHTLLKKIKHYYRQAFGISAFMIGGLAICRGLAEMEWIPHFAFNSHFVLF